jgi:hypothetical protein
MVNTDTALLLGALGVGAAEATGVIDVIPEGGGDDSGDDETIVGGTVPGLGPLFSSLQGVPNRLNDLAAQVQSNVGGSSPALAALAGNLAGAAQQAGQLVPTTAGGTGGALTGSAPIFDPAGLLGGGGQVPTPSTFVPDGPPDLGRTPQDDARPNRTRSGTGRDSLDLQDFATPRDGDFSFGDAVGATGEAGVATGESGQALGSTVSDVGGFVQENPLFTAGTLAGVAAAPFTGGSSLALVAGGAAAGGTAEVVSDRSGEIEGATGDLATGVAGAIDETVSTTVEGTQQATADALGGAQTEYDNTAGTLDDAAGMTDEAVGRAVDAATSGDVAGVGDALAGSTDEAVGRAVNDASSAVGGFFGGGSDDGPSVPTTIDDDSGVPSTSGSTGTDRSARDEYDRDETGTGFDSPFRGDGPTFGSEVGL